MQVEYPFRNYNLFQYLYVLSFYERARKDERFLVALAALETKLDDGRIVVERVVPKLAGLNFCRKGQPSELATAVPGAAAQLAGDDRRRCPNGRRFFQGILVNQK